jgi:hypothetical protein
MSLREATDIATRINNRVLSFATGATHADAGNHCHHCVGAGICEALSHSIYAMWKSVSSRSVMVPSNQQLADELDMLDRMAGLLKARTEAVKAEAEFRMDDQQTIPGWAKMPTAGKRKFTVEGDLIEALTGVDPWEKRKLCTPAELERRGVDPTVVRQMSTTPTVGHKLTRVDDKQIGALFEKGKIK